MLDIAPVWETNNFFLPKRKKPRSPAAPQHKQNQLEREREREGNSMQKQIKIPESLSLF